MAVLLTAPTLPLQLHALLRAVVSVVSRRRAASLAAEMPNARLLRTELVLPLRTICEQELQ